MESETFTPEQMITAIADLVVNHVPLPESLGFSAYPRLEIRTASDSPLLVDLWLKLMASDATARIGGTFPDGKPFSSDGRLWCTYGVDTTWMGWWVHVWCDITWPKTATSETAVAELGV